MNINIGSILSSIFICLFVSVAGILITVVNTDSKTEEGHSTHDFVFDRLNQAYKDMAPKISEIKKGPLTIHLASPKQVIVLHEHVLTVSPLSDRIHSLRLQVDFDGEGDLVANIDLMGISGNLSDRFWIPRQKKEVMAEARIIKTDKGYEIKPIKLPKAVKVRIRTGLSNNLVDWCNGMSLLSPSFLDCQGIERSLTELTVPLHQDRTYFLEASSLTLEEEKSLGQYLGNLGAR